MRKFINLVLPGLGAVFVFLIGGSVLIAIVSDVRSHKRPQWSVNQPIEPLTANPAAQASKFPTEKTASNSLESGKKAFVGNLPVKALKNLAPAPPLGAESASKLLGVVKRASNSPRNRKAASVGNTAAKAPKNLAPAPPLGVESTSKLSGAVKRASNSPQSGKAASGGNIAVKAPKNPTPVSSEDFQGTSKIFGALQKVEETKPEIVPATRRDIKRPVESALPRRYRVAFNGLNLRATRGTGRIVERVVLDQKLTVYRIVDGWALVSPPAAEKRWFPVKYLAPAKPAAIRGRASTLAGKTGSVSGFIYIGPSEDPWILDERKAKPSAEDVRRIRQGQKFYTDRAINLRTGMPSNSGSLASIKKALPKGVAIEALEEPTKNKTAATYWLYVKVLDGNGHERQISE